jgi:23S rRNA pseudoU1915 N3-methylase RlmH
MANPTNKQLIKTIEWVEEQMGWGKFAKEEEKKERNSIPVANKKPNQKRKSKKELSEKEQELANKKFDKWKELVRMSSNGEFPQSEQMQRYCEWLNSKDGN